MTLSQLSGQGVPGDQLDWDVWLRSRQAFAHLAGLLAEVVAPC